MPVVGSAPTVARLPASAAANAPRRSLLFPPCHFRSAATNAVPLERFHPQYRELHAELLARPFPAVAGLVMVAHRAVFFAPGEAAAHRAAVAALATYPGVTATPAEHGFQLLRLNQVDLRIEPHTEFTSFTVLAPQAGVPFAASALDQLPDGWLDDIPGQILAAVEIASELVPPAEAGTAKTMEKVAECFHHERLVGAFVVERVASVWSHFRLDPRGATRFLVQGHRLSPGRYGRLLQRLVEMETYRMLALLGLPLARDLLPQIEALEARHVALVERIGVMDGDDRALLGELTTLSLATERLQAHSGSRFSLTGSYARILSARVRELREEQVPGYQTISEFFDRRLARALHACERADAGLSALADRLRSTTGLLRTRVEVNLQSQNQLLLASVDRRAATQLRLQHSVEGLSVVVLTYYLANLVKMLLEGAKEGGVAVNSTLIVALVVPVLAGAVWWVVHHAKRRSE
jgi:uncharacterized membrane-anchored protein